MKRGLLILCIASLLLLSACDNVSNIFKGGGDVVSGRGIQLSFEDYPRTSSLGEGEEFRIAVQVENTLPYNIQGRLCVRDSAPSRLGGIQGQGDCEEINIQAADEVENNIYEQAQLFAFPSTNQFYSYRGLDPDLPIGNNVIFAELDYLVQSKIGTTICVKRQGVPEDAAPDCDNVQTITRIQQPEAPIQLVKIQKSLSYKGNNEARLNLELHLRQTDSGGHVFTAENLGPELNIFDKPLLDIQVLYGNIPLSCSSIQNGKLEFAQSERVIKCFATVLTTQDFTQEVFELRLGYGFRTSIETPPITLKKEEAFA